MPFRVIKDLVKNIKRLNGQRLRSARALRRAALHYTS